MHMISQNREYQVDSHSPPQHDYVSQEMSPGASNIQSLGSMAPISVQIYTNQDPNNNLMTGFMNNQ